MSTNVNNVSTGKPKVGGAVFRAQIGTPLPTTAEEDLNEAFEDMGYISEDGVNNNNSRETEEIKAWGGDVVAQPQTSKTDTFGMTFIERKNVEVLKAVYGDDNVSGNLDEGIVVRANAKELANSSWVIDEILSEGDLQRTVIPNGKITETGEVSHTDGDLIGYESTITAFPYADWDGDSHREYMQHPTSGGGDGGGDGGGGDTDTLGELTVTSAAGSEAGKTAVTVTPAKDAANIYKIKLAEGETEVAYDSNVQNWTAWDGEEEIEATAGQVITVVEATEEYKARKAGHATVVVE